MGDVSGRRGSYSFIALLRCALALSLARAGQAGSDAMCLEKE